LLAFENTEGAIFVPNNGEASLNMPVVQKRPSRSGQSCRRWSAEEDAELLQLVALHGVADWPLIAEYMSGRSAGAIEQHYQVIQGANPSCLQRSSAPSGQSGSCDAASARLAYLSASEPPPGALPATCAGAEWIAPENVTIAATGTLAMYSAEFVGAEAVD
jgi:hypothetical protein